MSRLIATFFYVGLMRPAPGTWGSLAAIPAAWLINGIGGFPLLAIATIMLFPWGVWATKEATRGKADHDPSEIVIDEVIGQWIAIWPISFGIWQFGNTSWGMPWEMLLGAFLLFRLFDIWKPGPVGWADRRHDAIGVMLDDVIAGLMAAIVIFFGAMWLHRAFDLVEYGLWIF